MAKRLQKGLDAINEVALTICEIAMVVMVLVVFLQILSRTFIGSSFSWTEELARYLFIFFVLIGGGVVIGSKSHIAIDIIYNKLGTKGRKILCILSFLVVVIIAFILLTRGMELVSKTMVQKSPALQIPMGYIYAIFPVSAALMLLNSFSYTLRFLSGGIVDVMEEEKEEKPSDYEKKQLDGAPAEYIEVGGGLQKGGDE